MVEVENKIQRYETYKDSGVEWLGEIPEHWEVERGKWLFIKNERPVRDEDEIVTCFRNGEVTLRSNRKSSGFTVALKEHGYQGIRKGDLVIHAMDAFAGAIGVSDSDGKSTPVYSACTERNPGTVNQFYYSYFLRSLALNGIILALAKGIRERSTDFRFSDFGELLLSFPPLPEQTAIAQFLDDKTQKIDQAIGIKEQQIALLKERKQILIHKAVTRGLDDTVKLKNSGVEWIGEIPEHWEVKRLKYFVNIQGGFAFNSGDFVDEGIQIIKIANTYMNRLSLDRQPTFVNKSYLTSHKDWVVSKNDILMSLTGTLGKKDYGFAILIEDDEKYLLNQRVAKITVKKGFEPEYLLHLLRSDSYLNQLYCLPAGTKQANLSNDNVINIKMPIPPVIERKEISEYIESASQKIDTAVNIKQQEIEKLKEYKSSLINSVVTGKVKVS